MARRFGGLLVFFSLSLGMGEILFDPRFDRRDWFLSVCFGACVGGFVSSVVLLLRSRAAAAMRVSRPNPESSRSPNRTRPGS